ncbi:MAG: UDP-N-acetylglucosamine 2-epimerase (non-hydrolyzing) [Anaerolineae bacterium]|nr:UDP-N-acetylglucosamine 2-epimerase (non-hydrolyzing) [Anaerolineae bacterium]
MLTILTIIGTRPEAIKLAPVIRQLQQHPECVRSLVCVTGQHRDLLNPMLAWFNIKPDYDLNLMRSQQTLAYLTSAILEALDKILSQERPDWVLVQGDTTTALAGALAAFYQKIKVGHVEAGLRSGNRHQPFPEEINRRMIDQLATLHFTPTKTTEQNLLQEGLPAKTIHITGNTVIDALLETISNHNHRPNGSLTTIPQDRRLILVTTHRRENFGEPLHNICLAVRELAHTVQDSHFVLPVHPNPQVTTTVQRVLSQTPNVSLIKPLDYVSLTHLMRRCYLILTDSGGIQEEAPSLGIPVLVLRTETDRPEAAEAGVARIIGTNKTEILCEVKQLLNNESLYKRMSKVTHIYGDGQAARRIVNILLTWTDA